MAEPLSKVFAALGDPIRLDMVARLAGGDATVSALGQHYDISMAVSEHLKVLKALDW